MKSTIRIDKNSLVPVYRQIVSAIDSMIEAGTLKEGDVLPSMNELAEKLEISKETTKKAYLVLRDEGKIESKQGKGFYVKADGGGKETESAGDIRQTQHIQTDTFQFNAGEAR